MTSKSVTFTFIAKANEGKQESSYPVEIAYLASIADFQRKKTSFLRDKPEKIVYITKAYYPFWIAQAKIGVIIDGLNGTSHEFQFDEPVGTVALVEELRKNSADPEKFVAALETQTRALKDFTKPSNNKFKGLITDRELLNFLQEYLKTGTQLQVAENGATIPAVLNAEEVAHASQALINCFRTMEADARGLQSALIVLSEEAEFHVNAANNEIRLIEQKCESEIALIKPAVDKKVKRLAQQADRALAALQKSADRKTTTLEKRHESYLRRLQAAEQKRDSTLQTMNSAKKKKSSKSSTGSFALKKYEKNIDNNKKQVKALEEEIEKLRKNTTGALKQKGEDFQSAIAKEEAKITQVQSAYQAKISQQQKQISNVKTQTATVRQTLENLMNELRRSSNILKAQVEINWKPDDPEELIETQIPIYIVRYTRGEQEDRYLIFSPIAFSHDISKVDGLKKMLSLNPEPKLKALSHPVSKKLQETISTHILERLQTDAEFATKLNEMCLTNNVIALNSFPETLNEGLGEIEKMGYVTAEEASGIRKHALGAV